MAPSTVETGVHSGCSVVVVVVGGTVVVGAGVVVCGVVVWVESVDAGEEVEHAADSRAVRMSLDPPTDDLAGQRIG
jgi:hypothetical protein